MTQRWLATAEGEARLAAFVERVDEARRRESIAVAEQLESTSLAVAEALRVPEVFVGSESVEGSRVRAQEFAVRAIVAEISIVTGLSEFSVQRLAGHGETLRTRLPETWAALRGGLVGSAQARAVAEAAGTIPVLSPDDPASAGAARRLAAFDLAVLDAAMRLPVGKLRRALVALRNEAHPEGLRERFERETRGRRVWLDGADDGMAWLHAFLPAEAAAKAMARVEALADALADVTAEGDADAGDEAGDEAVDARTREQLRADVFADLLTGRGTEHEVGVTVSVTVPVLSLVDIDIDADDGDDARGRDGGDDSGDSSRGMGSGNGGDGRDGGETDLTPHIARMVRRISGRAAPCIDGVGPIDPVTARRLVGQSPTLTRLLTDPVSDALLSVDSRRYRPTADLKRFLRARDRGCTFPGCGAASHRTDMDHTDDWARGGETRADNLALLCRKHHRLKHMTRFTPDLDRGGGLRWRTPLGYEIGADDPPPF